MTSETTRRNQTRWKLTAKAKAKADADAEAEAEAVARQWQSKGKSKSKSKSKGAKPGKQDKECYVCGKKGHFARDRWSRANQDRIVNEVEDAKVDSDAGTEFVRTSSKIFEPKWLRNSLRRFGDDRQRSLSQYLTQVVWRIGS